MYPEGLSPSGTLFSVGYLPKKRMVLLCTSKHRVWSPKHRLVRNIPETFKGLGLSQQTAFCPQKGILAGMCHFKLGCFTINKVLISSSTVVALKCYPYPSKSIICIAYFKFLEFLNIWIFIFNSNRKTFVPTF